VSSCNGNHLFFCDSTSRVTELEWTAYGLTNYNSLGVDPISKSYDNNGEIAYNFYAVGGGDFIITAAGADCELNPEECNYCTKSVGQFRTKPLEDNPGYTYAFDYYVHVPTFGNLPSFKNPALLDKDALGLEKELFNPDTYDASLDLVADDDPPVIQN
jgi:hypothetical protein